MDGPVTRLRARGGSPADSAASTPLSESRSLSTTPSKSSSSTSLSSMGEDAAKKVPLLDTLGNEFEPPNYTIKDIRDAIPAHCFKRSAIRGLGYVARDMICLAGNFYLFNNHIIPALSDFHPLVRAVAWGAYSVLQGFFGTGIWVLAHECGHQAFSESKVINDTVGWILHSALLVPYFSWKISHGKHHHATGNMQRDMVFVPKTRSEYSRRFVGIGRDVSELTEETPIATLTHSLLQQLFGWPMYLWTNVTGHNYHSRQREGRGHGKQNGYFKGVNHFNPSSPLYEAKDAKLILLSDIGVGLTCYALYLASQTWGAANIALWYGIPYLWVNHWLVAITYLQHTDPTLPHYQPEAWNFPRGAAATIDRDFGFVGRHLLHGIIETHVAHHYVSTIPFYHADEATEAVKKVMGKHYRADTRGGAFGFLKAMWTAARWCQFVEPSRGATGEGQHILFFRNRNGLGVPPMPVEEYVPNEKELENEVLLGMRKEANYP
ncbi:hypothetical protein EX30DRAFT_160503 [Ascodesmis nigricans]|uniref:Fatty acid desaturase domain-containing protein n=1 Tax=Ascodesmis nigricans TaxID=341454 RepID=A0A4S2MS41_9PEZI|nr:hypothetical protein EX30DRAFT_160503 [Ascodesmis nigricans]